ncbi:GUN4 domain-containing protein [Chamaesiphon minutus]|uniref:DnaJ-class molecular chaperone with C-terminal Zn finger domain n=1 Tax=Chamaesiphon minutus (strain ATCC 27169 / PCC 6605) TaxID=1173020 RepID=K9UFX7_CHAP6|nr:GUN4 domain-containing protein [Chamaesiphon minutus]AFY94017.1 DnaJ-class molecular chaperone with C-terminal Zn finger domain [Chamaesiphon minutus PCC 6605]
MKLDRHYQVLEIEAGASQADIKQAYRNLAKVWHPDRFVGDPILQKQAQEKLIQINAAYEVLKSELPQTNIKTTEDKSVETSIQCERLEYLLKLGNLKDADLETKRLLLEIAGREREGWLLADDAKSISPQALAAIDRLWIRYSNGRFGFSVQRDIWHQLGCKSEDNMQIQTISENKFGEFVQWRVGGRWLSQWDDFNCDLQAPSGSLPRAYIFALNGWWSFSNGWTGYFLLNFDRIILKI